MGVQMSTPPTLAAELREVDEMMAKRDERFRKVLVTLKEYISSLPVTDPSSMRSFESYMHLIDFSYVEVDRVQRSYRGWLESVGKNRRGIS